MDEDSSKTYEGYQEWLDRIGYNEAEDDAGTYGDENPIWLGEELTLELHHKNGIRKDNRRENLFILCPNCHSQTDTHRGRKGKGR